MEEFKKRKQAVLSGVDLSRKGSVDAGITHLVELINSQPALVTTSSCSGRVCVVEQEPAGKVKKMGCKWLYMSHDMATAKCVEEAARKGAGDGVFKFEGFVLHVQCASLPYAQLMLSEAVAAGFRNSGMTISKKDRITVAVRSTHSMEAPLTHQGELLVSEKYIAHLVSLANTKFEENVKRIQRYYEGIEKAFLQLETGTNIIDSNEHSIFPHSKSKRKIRTSKSAGSKCLVNVLAEKPNVSAIGESVEPSQGSVGQQAASNCDTFGVQNSPNTVSQEAIYSANPPQREEHEHSDHVDSVNNAEESLHQLFSDS